MALAVATDGDIDAMEHALGGGQGFEIGGIVSGKVIETVGDQVVVDIGYKSEGLVPLNEWDEGEAPPQHGDSVDVLLEGMDDDTGEIVLSRAQGRPDARLGDGDLQVSRGRRRRRARDQEDQGRPARRHRRERLPARQPGRYPPPQRHRRLHRPDHRVHDPQDRRGPAQHRRLPPQADRDHPRAAQEEPPGRDRGRAGPQGDGQEHRRLRRVRRPRRDRRPAAHHRHVLGPDQPPERHGADRRPDRGHGPPRGQGPREDRPGPEAEDAPARGRTSPTSTRSAPASWARSST